MNPDMDDLEHRRSAHPSASQPETLHHNRLFWTIFSAVLWALIAFSVIETVVSAIFTRVAIMQAQKEMESTQRQLDAQMKKLRGRQDR